MNYITFVILSLILASCSNIKDVKDTTWVFSTEEGVNTIVFGDTTYISTIEYEGKKEQKTFKYYLDGDTIRLGEFRGNSFKAIVDDGDLIVYQNEIININDSTKLTNEYKIIYKKQKQ